MSNDNLHPVFKNILDSVCSPELKIKNNREIKFRGKRIDNEEWVYGNGVVVIDSEYSAIPQTNDVTASSYEMKLSKVIPNTVGQYTGLKDKNGKDIYEGDIFKYELPDPNYEEAEETSTEYIEKVVFEDGGFTLDNMPLGVAYEIGEVVGNIYENTDLKKNSPLCQ